MTIHSRYNKPVKPKTEFDETNPDAMSRTKQSFKDEVNINTIVKRGLDRVEPNPSRKPRYGDFTTGGDYQEMMNATAEAQSDFQLLPSGIRATFDNDVANMLDFLSDPANKKEAIEMGLIPDESMPKSADVGAGGPPQPEADQEGTEAGQAEETSPEGE